MTDYPEHDRVEEAGSRVLPADPDPNQDQQPAPADGTRVPGRPHGRPGRPPNLETYRFHVVPEWVTGELLLQIEEGENKPSIWLHVLAMFLHESTGSGLAPVPYEEAYKRVKKLTMLQMRDAFTQIWGKMKESMQDTPNPTNGSE